MVPPFMPSEMTKVSYNDNTNCYEVKNDGTDWLWLGKTEMLDQQLAQS